MVTTIIREFQVVPMDLMRKFLAYYPESTLDLVLDYEIKGHRIFAMDARRKQTSQLINCKTLINPNINIRPVGITRPETQRKLIRYSRAAVAGYVMAKWDIRDLVFCVPAKKTSAYDLWFLEGQSELCGTEGSEGEDENVRASRKEARFITVSILDEDDCYARAAACSFLRKECEITPSVKDLELVPAEDFSSDQIYIDIAYLSRTPGYIDKQYARGRNKRLPILDHLKATGFQYVAYADNAEDIGSPFERASKAELRKL